MMPEFLGQERLFDEEPESADNTISAPIWNAVAAAYDRQREPACTTSG